MNTKIIQGYEEERKRREMNYKIDSIIQFLEQNGEYDELRYNRSCTGELDSNIVEYAQDIADYFENNYTTNAMPNDML
jgi:hypothetical protein